jgi:predicted RNase H-like HicB family nuclease
LKEVAGLKLRIVIHEAEEGGYWAEVPALPGCYSQGETLAEVRKRIREAIACHLDVPLPKQLSKKSRIQVVEV